MLLAIMPAHAQVASFEGSSLSHLDPVMNQSTNSSRILEQMQGSNDMEAMIDIAPTDIMRKLARPVGRLTILSSKGFFGIKQKGSYCTASLITKDLLLTNYHCVPGLHGKVSEIMLTMGYLQSRKRTGVAQYRVNPKPVEASKSLDYAILRVEGNPGNEWGTIKLSSRTPGDRNSLFIIHHPGGFAKHISRGRCYTSKPAIDGNDILHICDTLPGSSGAPIFDNSSRKVVGLHFSAVALRKLNAGKRIASIAKQSSLVAGLVRQSVKPKIPQNNNTSELSAMRKRMQALEQQLKTEKARKKKEGKVAVGIYPDPIEQVQPRRHQRLSYEPEMVLVPGGTFLMGCVSGKGCQNDEKPVHRVTVSKFYMSKYETTFAQWDACVKDGGCKHKPKDEGWGRGSPVMNVSWNDANEYAKWLSGKTGEVWRLPTEAEWEYAARGGTKTKYSWGNRIDCRKANYGNGLDDSCKSVNPGTTKTVGSYDTNNFSLHDMHGNVWEWVSDWYGAYKKGSQTDPKGAKSGSDRVMRGGSGGDNARGLRSANRSYDAPDIRYSNIGFRLMRQPS